eukprot:SM000011S19160  [mRNA]  locus=s11:1326119:1327264:+ [translate_table: standard]
MLRGSDAERPLDLPLHLVTLLVHWLRAPIRLQAAQPACHPEPSGVASSVAASAGVEDGQSGGRRGLAVASVAAAVGLFLSTRLAAPTATLASLAVQATPYDEALANGRPTVVEFYADWCEVCKEMAREVGSAEDEYRDRVNFVMLNVDNSKWDAELDEFGVEGIPHFAFLDAKGDEQGYVVGRLPRSVLNDNLAAMARGDATLPYSQVVGSYSSAGSRQQVPNVSPRSHSK